MWIQEEQKMADKETEQIKKLNQTVHSKDTRERDQAYNEYVKQVTPTHNLIFHMVKAFFTGGIICCIGQFILNTCENYGLDKDKCRINIASLLGSSGRIVLSLWNSETSEKDKAFRHLQTSSFEPEDPAGP